MQIILNMKWNVLSQFIKIFVQLVNIVFLARIIPPEEYGIMAMALVVINFGLLFRDMGTSAAIIQRKDLTNELVNAIFWLNLFVGGSVTLFVIFLAPFFSSFYGQPQLLLVLIALSVIFPLSSCSATHIALLERKSHFKKISMIEIPSSLISLVVAIFVAMNGGGVFSLVVQAILASLLSSVLFWRVSPWRPSFNKLFDKAELKSIFGFSSNLVIFNFINYFSRNADSFILGKFMSASILGSYNLAYRIMLFPLQSLTFVTTRSLYPVLSKNQEDNELIGSTYLNCVFFILFITAPLMAGLAFYSHQFINLVFGSEWTMTAGILVWLAPTAVIQSVLSTSGVVFMAKGRTDVLRRLGFIGAILQVISFVIGVNFNIYVFAMCYLIANVINFFPVMIYLLRLIESNLMCFFKKIYSIFVSTLVMLFALQFLGEFVFTNGISNLLCLFVFSFLGGVIYLMMMFLVSPFIRTGVIVLMGKLIKIR